MIQQGFYNNMHKYICLYAIEESCMRNNLSIIYMQNYMYATILNESYAYPCWFA